MFKMSEFLSQVHSVFANFHYFIIISSRKISKNIKRIITDVITSIYDLFISLTLINNTNHFFMFEKFIQSKIKVVF